MDTNMKQEYIGDGTTTKQLKEAKQNAYFICSSDACADYTKRLAINLNRPDINIVTPSWIIDRRFRGLEISDIILDHYYVPTRLAYEILKEAEARIS